MSDLFTAATAVQAAACAEYATTPDRFTAPGAWLFADLSPTLDAARRELAAIIPADPRTRRELAARNMPTPDARTGEHLANQLARAAILAADHAARSGGIVDAGGFGACPCRPGGGHCGTRGIFRAAWRDVLARGVTPGNPVARIVIRNSYGTGHGTGSAPVRGFLIDGCGGPFDGDYLDGGCHGEARHITPEFVGDYMRRMRQPWRLVTRAEAATTIVAAGYRLCGNPGHGHSLGPVDTGPVVWRAADDPAWHVNHGAMVAYVVAA